MKIYTVERIRLSKLYLFVFFGVLTYVILMILLISLIALIFPEFDNVSLFFVLTALICGNYIYKFSFLKSSKKIQIKLNEKKLVIEEEEFLLDNIKSLKIKGTRFNYYPKIIIELANAKKINFRISKNNEFEKLILALKFNSKTNSIFSY